jgi:DNA mismatch repair protein MutS2
MDDYSLRVLEFLRLIDFLKELSTSLPGRRRCEALRPSKDLHQIESRLSEVIELKGVVESSGDIPIRGLKDIEPTLRKLELEGSVLDIQELLDICNQIVLCKGLQRFFLRLEITRAPRLQEKVSRFSSLKSLEREILQAIDTKGELLDLASPTLSDIRRRLGTVRERAKAVLEHLLHQEELRSIFQEDFITLRNGRYVVLVKSESKYRLDGIIHDQSQSGASFYVEPFQIVPLNNEINILAAEEREEEYRILSDLSEKARAERENLWRDFGLLGELDFLFAMARLTLLLKGVKPELNEEGRIDLKEARNPLLALQREDHPVPIHLRMGEGIRCLILSGANAGGKTVGLKTLGLLTLMVQSGLPIPVAEGSEAAVFHEVFAVVGDEQNIEENLSTFSSHLLHLNRILEKAGPRSLLLLDELGVGTHASEGCALAMAFMDQFLDSGASMVVTTHFDRLKVYGYAHPGVENVAVEFDEETLEPRYTLSYGASGLSNAFLVAEKLGVSKEVLEKAHRYQDGGEQEVADALESLERLKADVEKLQQKLLQKEEEVGRERRRLKELVEAIKKRRQEILSRSEEKARKAVQRFEEEMKEWARMRKEEKAAFNVRRFRKEVEEIKERSFPSAGRKEVPSPPGGFRVGERVKILSLRSQGTLVSLDESLKIAEVSTDRAKVRTHLSDLARIDGGEEKGRGIVQDQVLRDAPQEVSSELNVIGLTVEDAVPVVDKFIDQALLHGLAKVEIIHGFGSGRLRRAIGKYLQGHRGVRHFGPGEGMRGGGVTVVELA